MKITFSDGSCIECTVDEYALLKEKGLLDKSKPAFPYDLTKPIEPAKPISPEPIMVMYGCWTPEQQPFSLNEPTFTVATSEPTIARNVLLENFNKYWNEAEPNEPADDVESDIT